MITGSNHGNRVLIMVRLMLKQTTQCPLTFVHHEKDDTDLGDVFKFSTVIPTFLLPNLTRVPAVGLKI